MILICRIKNSGTLLLKAFIIFGFINYVKGKQVYTEYNSVSVNESDHKNLLSLSGWKPTSAGTNTSFTVFHGDGSMAPPFPFLPFFQMFQFPPGASSNGWAAPVTSTTSPPPTTPTTAGWTTPLTSTTTSTVGWSSTSTTPVTTGWTSSEGTTPSSSTTPTAQPSPGWTTITTTTTEEPTTTTIPTEQTTIGWGWEEETTTSMTTTTTPSPGWESVTEEVTTTSSTTTSNPTAGWGGWSDTETTTTVIPSSGWGPDSTNNCWNEKPHQNLPLPIKARNDELIQWLYRFLNDHKLGHIIPDIIRDLSYRLNKLHLALNDKKFNGDLTQFKLSHILGHQNGIEKKTFR